jgi:hypothetical protein
MECSLTGDFKLVLRKKAALADQPYADLTDRLKTRRSR